MPARSLYVGQLVQISSAFGTIRTLPVQSANCEVSRPIEDILSFGHLGSLKRVQNAVSTCKATIKTYLSNDTGVSLAAQHVDKGIIDEFTGQALLGLPSIIVVSPNGFTMSGILSSISMEISQGSFATSELVFNGIGEPIFDPAPTGSSFSEQATMPTLFAPVTISNVSGQLTSGCANSFKFSLDLPNESLNCLGGSITGTQGAVSSSFIQVAKPPFKASITVEGSAVDAPVGSALSNNYYIGKVGISLPSAKVTSQSFNNAVGSSSATYNYTIEDVTANFTGLFA